MRYTDEDHDLRVQIQSHHYELSPEIKERMESDLEALRKLVRAFPVAELHVDISRHVRRKDFHLRTSLRLPQKTLFTGERDIWPDRAYEQCIRKLVNKVKAYKEALGRKPAQERVAAGLVHEVYPSREPDLVKLADAAREGDYFAFREELRVYQESLDERIGRWIQRYPEAQAMLGRELVLSDIVEEVYLQAFERFLDRPSDRLGNWLGSLIDPSLKALFADPDGELDNIRFVK